MTLPLIPSRRKSQEMDAPRRFRCATPSLTCCLRLRKHTSNSRRNRKKMVTSQLDSPKTFSTHSQSRSSGHNYMAQKTKTCKECGQRRRITQFSLIRKIEDNKGTSRKFVTAYAVMCNYDGLYANEPHKILREAYRNYLTFKQFVTTLDVTCLSIECRRNRVRRVRASQCFVH
jgi:hypothetical protein